MASVSELPIKREVITEIKREIITEIYKKNTEQNAFQWQNVR